MLFDPPKFLSSLLLCNTCLLALWMLSICLAILVVSFVIVIFGHFIQYVFECLQSSISIGILPFGSDVTPDMSWFWTKLIVVNCASGLSNLSILDQSVCFWSLVLEIIIPLLSKHRIIQMFYNMMPVHSFFLWLSTDTHISSVVDRPIQCWISSDIVLHIQ